MKKDVFIDIGNDRDKPLEAYDDSSKGRGFSLIIALGFFAIIALSIYLVFRGMAFLNPGYNWLDRVFAVFLLASECFLAIHTIGFLSSVTKSTKRYHVKEDHFFVRSDFVPVAVVVATYNEDPTLLEETLSAMVALDYPEKKLYLLDDSTNQGILTQTEALAKEYQFVYIHRTARRGYKAGALNDLISSIKEKYIAVFDADQKPMSTFLDETVSLLEEDTKLAFVQTPQYYSNTEKNAVAFGASYQQVVFYEYICEGKSVSNAMFSCGSNVVYRREALQSIGGFEEESVTEDFATGFKLHLDGWKSIYYNYVYVYGIGPESLSGYFTQQMRWAMGTLQGFRRLVSTFIKRPRALNTRQWWEYFLSSSYYCIGWVNFLLMLCPIVFLLADVRPLIANPLYYGAAFLPYFIFATSTFYFSMRRRGYKPIYLLIGQSLSLNAFWILMNAAIMAVFNIKRPFGVTPKGVSERVSIKYLLPQIIIIIASLVAMAVGIYKVFNGYGLAMIINILWAGYHVVLLSMIFYFNRSFETYKPETVFVEIEI